VNELKSDISKIQKEKEILRSSLELLNSRHSRDEANILEEDSEKKKLDLEVKILKLELNNFKEEFRKTLASFQNRELNNSRKESKSNNKYMNLESEISDLKGDISVESDSQNVDRFMPAPNKSSRQLQRAMNLLAGKADICKNETRGKSERCSNHSFNGLKFVKEQTDLNNNRFSSHLNRSFLVHTKEAIHFKKKRRSL